MGRLLNLFNWLSGKPFKKSEPTFHDLACTSTRFSIRINGVERKIFSYFPAAADGSIAFKSYLPSTSTGELTLEKGFEGKAIEFENMERRDDFIIDKVNIHKSGIVSRKNRQGEWFSQEVIRASSFEKFNEEKSDLCFIMPTHWEKYPIIDVGKAYTELTLGNLDVLPPLIQFYVAKNSSRIQGANTRQWRTTNFFVDTKILERFNLNLYISVRAHKDAKYPPSQVFSVYMYDNTVD